MRTHADARGCTRTGTPPFVGKLAVSPVSFQGQTVHGLFLVMELIVDPTYFLGQFQAILKSSTTPEMRQDENLI